MKQRTKIIGIIALLAFSLAISACGQRKPLQTPEGAITDEARF